MTMSKVSKELHRFGDWVRRVRDLAFTHADEFDQGVKDARDLVNRYAVFAPAKYQPTIQRVQGWLDKVDRTVAEIKALSPDK